jgi:hypothetical protein
MRSQSTNNLKQIALGFHNYADSHDGGFPYMVDFGPGSPTGAMVQSIFFQVLPYVEQGNLYQSVPQPNTQAELYAAAKTTVKVFVSPADGSNPSGRNPQNPGVVITAGAAFVPPGYPTMYSSTDWATMSYAANGLLWQNSLRTSLTQFSDGMSNTILLAERAQSCGGVGNLWAMSDLPPEHPTFATTWQGAAIGNKISPALPLQTASGDTIAFTAQPILVLNGSTPGAPPAGANGRPIVPFQTAPRASECDPRVPQTPHTGGMLIALCDGSVRVAAPQMSQFTFWAACTPAGGEVLGDDW